MTDFLLLEDGTDALLLEDDASNLLLEGHEAGEQLMHAVVRQPLPATISGTVDFTADGIGTITAALIFLSSANNLNNPQEDAAISVGFWDGTDQRCVAAYSDDAAPVSREARASSDSEGAILLQQVAIGGTSTIITKYSVSAVTDGIRLTCVEDNTGAERFCTVLLLSGISAKLITFTPNSTQDGTQESASLGFAPELIFFGCVGDTTADTATSQAVLSFGFAESSGKHRCFLQGHEHDVTVSNNTMLFSETRCVGQAFTGTLAWSGEVTTFGSDTFTMTTREGASGGDVCFALALGGAGLSFDCGTLTSPASTGTDAVTTTIEPDVLLTLLSTCTGTSLETGNGAEGLSIGLADATNEYSHSTVVEDGAGTSNALSYASAAAILDLNSSASGSVSAVADATVDSFNATDFTLNWSVVPGTAVKGWWVAFGAEAAGDSVSATAALTTADATMAASATHEVPTYTGSASPTTAPATMSASATSATVTFEAAANLTTAATTMEASGTFTVPEFTASAALTTAPATMEATAAFATEIYQASAVLTTAPATMDSSATFAEGTFTATADLNTAAATISATATFEAPSYTASADLQTAAATMEATAVFAEFLFSATAALTTSPATMSASAEFVVSGEFNLVVVSDITLYSPTVTEIALVS